VSLVAGSAKLTPSVDSFIGVRRSGARKRGADEDSTEVPFTFCSWNFTGTVEPPLNTLMDCSGWYAVSLIG